YMGAMSERPMTSTRDLDHVATRLRAWFARQVEAEAPQLSDLRRPGGAGLSSETLLFEAAWSTGNQACSGSYVLRLPPPGDAFPLFPSYDLARQVTAMRFVGEHSAVPVPSVPWFEEDETVLGAPFFVMDRVDGVGVSDSPPYTFGSWVAEADAANQ